MFFFSLVLKKESNRYVYFLLYFKSYDAANRTNARRKYHQFLIIGYFNVLIVSLFILFIIVNSFAVLLNYGAIAFAVNISLIYSFDGNKILR